MSFIRKLFKRKKHDDKCHKSKIAGEGQHLSSSSNTSAAAGSSPFSTSTSGVQGRFFNKEQEGKMNRWGTGTRNQEEVFRSSSGQGSRFSDMDWNSSSNTSNMQGGRSNSYGYENETSRGMTRSTNDPYSMVDRYGFGVSDRNDRRNTGRFDIADERDDRLGYEQNSGFSNRTERERFNEDVTERGVGRGGFSDRGRNMDESVMMNMNQGAGDTRVRGMDGLARKRGVDTGRNDDNLYRNRGMENNMNRGMDNMNLDRGLDGQNMNRGFDNMNTNRGKNIGNEDTTNTFQTMEVTVAEISKIQLAKVIVSLIGNEGHDDNEQEASLRRLLQAAIEYIPMENETVWKDAEIKIFDIVGKVTILASGDAGNKFTVHLDENDKIEIINTQRPDPGPIRSVGSYIYKKFASGVRGWIHLDENDKIEIINTQRPDPGPIRRVGSYIYKFASGVRGWMFSIWRLFKKLNKMKPFEKPA